MIKGYPKGSDITILDTIYEYPQRKDDGKYSNGLLQVLYKDNKTGEKKLEEIDNPTYVFYKANDDVVIEHNLFFIEKEKVHEIEVPFKDLLKVIAEETDNTEFFYDNLKNRNRRANNVLHTIPEIFNSDINIEDHFRFRFDNYYVNKSINISKTYFDIEADTIDMVGDFPELGECPINALTYVNPNNKKVYTFLLRNEKNELIHEFETEVKNGTLFTELKEFIINHVGGEEAARSHNILDYDYHMYFYDEEINLISDFFTLLNIERPDFLLAWNMSFDIPYIIERIRILGYDPADIICPKDVKHKLVKYYIDVENNAIPAARGDFFTISGYTIFQDQMVHFASRRKGQSAFESFSLNYIGEKIAKVNKLDFSHITRSIKKLPYLDYKTFVFYNIMDTIVQDCIENKVNDIGYIFNKCLLNNTRYHKGHRQTVYLTNRGVKNFYNAGYIMGNNKNRGNEKPPKFPGAMVGDPLNNNDYSKEKINGVAINIAKNLVDYDYKSLYPSVTREFNIAPNTQIGRLDIPNPVHPNENPFNYGKYSRGGQFIQDFTSGNYIEFCKRWLHLGGFMDVIEDMKEYYKIRKPYGYMGSYDNQLIREYDIEPSNQLVIFEPFTRYNNLVHFDPENRTFEEEIREIKRTAQMDIDSIEQIMRRKQREEEEDKGLVTMSYPGEK